MIVAEETVIDLPYGNHLPAARADVVVCRCQDPRFKPLGHMVPELLGIPFERVEDIVVPGGAKEIVIKNREGGMIWNGCEIGVNKHGAQKIVLVNHQNCGAYESVRTFRNLSDEMSYHEKQLRRAARNVERRFPSIEIEAYFALMNGEIKLQRMV